MDWLNQFQTVEKSFQNEYSRLYGYMPRSVTFIVTEACNLCCTYCYQHNKTARVMPFDVAKKCIDTLFAEDAANSEYINPEEANGIILDFIGGEPLLEIDLIDRIVDYFLDRAIELDHRWAVKYMISMSTNGTLYHKNNVQRFVKKHEGRLSIGVTIDGDKELHDMCRLYPDGRGSYDDAAAAFDELLHKYHQSGTKLTLAPANIQYLYKAARNMFERFGMSDLHANCVFEEGWDWGHAKIMYDQLKQMADWLLDNDYEGKYHISLFDYTKYQPMSRDDDQNWCFKAGTMVLTDAGYKPIEDIKIGDVVINKYGRKHPVENVMKHYAEDCCVLRVAGAYDIHATLGHKVWARKFQYMGNKNTPHYSEPAWVKISDLRKKDRIAIPKRQFGSECVPTSLAYIVGRYIGDGCSSTSTTIVCPHSEAASLRNKLDEAGLRYGEYTTRTVENFQIHVSAVKNKEFFEIISSCGSTALRKRLPSNIYDWNEESAAALLAGYLDSDGCCRDKRYKANTVSKVLAVEVMDLIRALGYYPTCSFAARDGKTHIIEGREVNVHDRYDFEFQLDKTTQRYKHFDDDLLWVSVRAMLPDTPGEVYNITVADEHEYIAEGISVANCGGTGKMLAFGVDGTIYPCLRYAPASLGPDVKPLVVGHIEHGIERTDEEKETTAMLRAITRSSQSTEECMNCPIAQGCAWCSAYNYERFGTPNRRATFICCMHKATALANVYFWNKLVRKYGAETRIPLRLPEADALNIIDKSEYDMLKELAAE